MEQKEYEEYCKHYNLAVNTKQPLPEIGKEYNYYDDGKIRQSRHSIVKIIDIIPYNEANREIINFFERMKKEYHWVWDKETDYFIIGYNKSDIAGFTMIFAKMNGISWYGFDTAEYQNWTGRLITHPDFDPTKI